MTIFSDILIIGGGISGLLTARELCLAGLQVAIIDKSASGQESSWAGGGILLPIYPWRQASAISELVIQSHKKYPGLNQELLAATGIDPEWHACGMLICKNPDHQAASAWCQHYQIPYHAAFNDQLTPFNTQFEQPLWLPEIAQIRNPRFLQAMKAYLLNLGVRFFEQSQITRLDITGHSIQQLNTLNQQFSFKELIFCTGAWTAEVLENLQLTNLQIPNLPIQPVKGQMLLFDAQPNTLNTMVLDGDHYLIPRRDGKILAGSTVEEVGFDKTITSQAKQEIYAFATQLLPALKNFPLQQHWAGLRPGSPEGIPFIGRHPHFNNLSINAGHFRNGLVMGPASAQLLADLLLERPPLVNPAPFALG
jgi:glycine oxidase